MPRFFIAPSVLLVSCAAIAVAQEPPQPAGIQELIKDITDLRAKQAELKKAEEAKTAALQKALDDLQKQLDKLGLNGPKPPTPPKPPVDPLATKLRVAFDADAQPLDKRRESAKDLAELYRQASKLAADESVPTSGELLSRVRDAAAKLVGADALQGVRKIVGAELGALLPTDDALTASQRKSVAELFGKLASILEEMAK